MIISYTNDFVVRGFFSFSLELFHFQLCRFLLQGLANNFAALLQYHLDQEVQKSSNYSAKLIYELVHESY